MAEALSLWLSPGPYFLRLLRFLLKAEEREETALTLGAFEAPKQK